MEYKKGDDNREMRWRWKHMYVILLTCKRQSRRWSQAFLVYRDQADLSLRTLDKILGDEKTRSSEMNIAPVIEQSS